MQDGKGALHGKMPPPPPRKKKRPFIFIFLDNVRSSYSKENLPLPYLTAGAESLCDAKRWPPRDKFRVKDLLCSLSLSLPVLSVGNNQSCPKSDAESSPMTQDSHNKAAAKDGRSRMRLQFPPKQEKIARRGKKRAFGDSIR